MTKFMLYAVRNVFTPQQAQQQATAPVASSSSSDARDSELDALEAQLAAMKDKAVQAERDYLTMANKCRDMDHLLKEMRNALFTLRVASQSFEELGSHNLDEAAALIQQYKLKLQQCTEQANGKASGLLAPCSL